MKSSALCAVLVLWPMLWATESHGQNLPGLPVCPDGIHQNEMVELIRTNAVESRCNATEAQMRDDLNRRLSSAGVNLFLGSREEHAAFVARLDRHMCVDVVGSPPATVQSSWVDRATREIRNTGWARPCQPGEVILCDSVTNYCPYLESCWNVTQEMVRPPAILQQAPLLPSFLEVGGTVQVDHSGNPTVTHIGSIQLLPPPPGPSWMSRNWPWVAGGILGTTGAILLVCHFTDLCGGDNTQETDVENKIRIR
jgi:hypothetical protein